MLNLVSILRMPENHSAVKRVIFTKLFGSIKRRYDIFCMQIVMMKEWQSTTTK